MKRAILLMIALSALGADLPDLRVEELRNNMGRANEEVRRLRATVEAIDGAAEAQRALAVLEGQLAEYELRMPEVTLLRGRIKRLDSAITSAEQRWFTVANRIGETPVLGALGPMGLYSSRNQSDLLSAWIDYGRAMDARAAAADDVARLARLEQNLEALRVDIASGVPAAGIPAGMTIDQARNRRAELTRALADAGRVAPGEIDLVRARLAAAEAQVRQLESELARETAPTVAQEPPAIEPARIEPPPAPPPVVEPAHVEPPVPDPVPVIPTGTAQLTAEVYELDGYGAPEGYEDDEQCTWVFDVRFTSTNGIPVELKLDRLQRDPAEIQKAVAKWAGERFWVPGEVTYFKSLPAMFRAMNWKPGRALSYYLGPHTLTVARRNDYSGTYRAVFSGIDANKNPVHVSVVWTSPGRPPVGPPQVRPVPQPAPPPQPAPVRATRAVPGVYSGGLDPDSWKSAKEKVRGFELVNLTGTDATVRVRNDGRVEVEGVFMLTIETSGLLDRGTKNESRFFDRRDTSFAGTTPGAMDRFDLEFQSERNFRVRRTDRNQGSGPRPSVLGRDAPPGTPDKHETKQGHRIAKIEFDPKTGDLLLHVDDGLAAVPDVPWRLRRQQ